MSGAVRGPKTLNDILPASAARSPTAPAFMIKPGFRTRAWTYRALADVVPRVAAYFAEAGIQRGDRVVIWGVNRPEYCIAFLGALHAGAILVPIDLNSLPDHARKFAERKRSLLDRGDRADWKHGNGFRGDVEVVFGDPLSFPALTNPAEATRKIEAAVEAL